MRNGVILNGYLGSHVAYQFFPDRAPSVVAGSRLIVDGVVQSRGWIDACCTYGEEGPRRLTELDLSTAFLPDHPGTYFVELSVHVVGWTGAGAPGSEPLTFLFPVHVTSPESP